MESDAPIEIREQAFKGYQKMVRGKYRGRYLPHEPLEMTKIISALKNQKRTK